MQDAAGPPRPADVLYVHPNPDGSRKRCGNCLLWCRTDQCTIHDAQIEVTQSMVCGYHVYGQPTPQREERGQDPVDPDISGLTIAPGDGTSCDTCRWYEARVAGGLCRAVVDPVSGESARVEALGCCARWEPVRGNMPRERPRS